MVVPVKVWPPVLKSMVPLFAVKVPELVKLPVTVIVAEPSGFKIPAVAVMLTFGPFQEER